MSLADDMADFEVEFEGRTFTKSQLDTAFDRVANVYDWKAPIDTIIDAADLLITQAAVQFHTATELQVVAATNPKPGTIRVTSIGYRAGPAGDH